jgi:hypothetical protein
LRFLTNLLKRRRPNILPINGDKPGGPGAVALSPGSKAHLCRVDISAPDPQAAAMPSTESCGRHTSGDSCFHDKDSRCVNFRRVGSDQLRLSSIHLRMDQRDGLGLKRTSLGPCGPRRIYVEPQYERLRPDRSRGCRASPSGTGGGCVGREATKDSRSDGT